VPPFGTYTVHLWLVGKVFELFSPALTVEALYEGILVLIVVFERGRVILSVNFRRKGTRELPTNDCWRQKTRVPGLSHSVVCAILRLAVLIQTHRHTTTANIGLRHRHLRIARAVRKVFFDAPTGAHR